MAKAKHPGGPGGPGNPNPPGHNGFEAKVLASLTRIESQLDTLTENVQTVDNKIDLLILKVEECCEEKPPPPPRPTGVQINQLIRRTM